MNTVYLPIYLFFKLILERDRDECREAWWEWERLTHCPNCWCTHWLTRACALAGDRPTALACWDDALTNWALWPRPPLILDLWFLFTSILLFSEYKFCIFFRLYPDTNFYAFINYPFISLGIYTRYIYTYI